MCECFKKFHVSRLDLYVYPMFHWVSMGKNGTKICQKQEDVRAI